MSTSPSTDYNPSTGSFRADLRYVGYAGALAVALGAFGAHALESHLDADGMNVYATASQYHFIHVLAMLGVLGLHSANQNAVNVHRRLRRVVRFFALGTAIFSGSLYVLATRALLGLDGATWIGAVTPFGGVLLILGWIALAHALTARDEKGDR